MGGKLPKAALVPVPLQWTLFKCQVESFFQDSGEIGGSIEENKFSMSAETFFKSIRGPTPENKKAPGVMLTRFLKHVFDDCRAPRRRGLLGSKGRTGCDEQEKQEWRYDEHILSESDKKVRYYTALTKPGKRYSRYSKTVASSLSENDQSQTGGHDSKEIIVDQLETNYSDGPEVSVICVSYVQTTVDGQRHSIDEVIFEHQYDHNLSGGVEFPQFWRWRSPLSGKGVRQMTEDLREQYQKFESGAVPEQFKIYSHAAAAAASPDQSGGDLDCEAATAKASDLSGDGGSAATGGRSAFTDLHPVELAASEWVWHGVAATGLIFILVLIFFFFYRYAAAAAAAPPPRAGSAFAGSSLENSAGDHDEEHHNKNYGSTSSKANPFMFYSELADDGQHSSSDAEHESSPTAATSNGTTDDQEQGATRLSAVRKRAGHAKNLKKVAGESSKDELRVDDDQPDFAFGENYASASVVGAEIRECQSAARQRVLPSREPGEAGSKTL